ncbi:hypothetical protein DFH07DRAFT_949340 [Mycena maculata]|uniref:Fungal N-terminal domain-containing protein n=1 Tax=Mycena maculata TaxID=230809 RepID=A0AAD7P0F4_9AGAR|nr:hypothetical protein DFH07DRAFT_949340 [Mycena maculata]
MEALTLATTVLAFATFIKDLIELGQSIKESIEKVGENRRQIRELANDVLRSLADIANLTRGKEDDYQAPALLGALGDLKANMLHVLSVCRKVIPAERRLGLRGIGSQVKIWMKRDEVEREIRRLKEHVNACYIKFTAFSAARIEETAACVEETTALTAETTARIEDMSLDTVNTTLRVEQTLIVNHVESRVQLRRLEGMMAQVLLETPFGQNVMDRTVEIISYDQNHDSLESQYLSVQIMHLIESLQHLVAGGNFDLDLNILSDGKDMFIAPTTPLHLLHQILGMILDIQNGTLRPWISPERHLIFNLGPHMCNLGLISEAIAWELLVIQILGHGAPSDCSGRFMAHLARSRRKLSQYYRRQLRHELALQASEQSLRILRSFSDPPLDLWEISMATLVTHSMNLCQVGQHEVAITIAQEAVVTCRPMVAGVIQFASDMSANEEYSVVISSEAFFAMALSLSTVGRHLEAYEASKEGFRTVLKFSGFIRHPAGTFIDSFIHQICKVAEEDELSLSMLRETVLLFRDLARNYPEEFSPQFLRLLYAYMYLDEQKTSPNFSASLKTLRIFLEPESRSPPPSLGESNNFFVISDQYGGVTEDVIRGCYVLPLETEDIRAPLLRKIFLSNFDQAITILQGVASSSTTESWHPGHHLTWALYDIIDVLLPSLPHSQQLVLLQLWHRYAATIHAI